MIKNRLIVLMFDNDVSFAELSRETGISVKHLRRIAANQMKSISYEHLDALCKFFECTPAALLKKYKEKQEI